MKFESKFGHSIGEYPGYWEFYNQQRAGAIPATEITQTDLRDPVGFYSFAKDAFEYSMMMDFIHQNRVKSQWRHALDIGGMEGTVSRLLKSNGHSETVDCVDIHDYSVQLPDQLYKEFVHKHKIYRRFRKSHVLHNFPQHFDYQPSKSSTLNKINLGTDNNIDNYFVRSFYDLEVKYKYEYVSALLCMPYFELEKFFKKLSELIEMNGLFFFTSDYWWGQCNSTGLVGGIPWGIQRLTPDDFLRYFSQRHPEINQNLISKRYSYYHEGKQRPTLSDYVSIAGKHGFSLIAAKRHFGDQIDNERIFVTPDDLAKFEPLENILRDIKHIREGVCELDIKTSFLTCLFVKA